MASFALRPKARRDLRNQFVYIARENLAAADAMLKAADTAFATLAENPNLGPAIEFDHPATRGMRMWSITGFEKLLVFYFPVPRGIEVVRVLHSRRDISRIFRRKP